MMCKEFDKMGIDKRIALIWIGQTVEILLFVAAGILYFHTAFSLGLGREDGGPDEMMRALIPRCILNGHLFPSGYDSCAIYGLGNWSYAFYPQMLAGYISAFFMFIAKSVGLSASLIFVSGRFASIVFGLIALLALDRSVAIVFSNRSNAVIFRCLAVGLLGFWPQFAFLSSYMNNDIAALSGVSVLVYALISGLKQRWTTWNCVVLALGITMCGLGYWNSYGFILMAIVIFLITVYLQNIGDRKRGLKLTATAAGLAAVAVLPWFAANVIRYHDLIGMATFRARYYQWLQDGGQQLQNPYSQGIVTLLLHSDFVRDTMQSFVAYFGSLYFAAPYALTVSYYLLGGIVSGLMLAHVTQRWRDVRFRMMVIGCVSASLITLGLFIFYALHTDYQPQGRYIIYLLIPFIIMAVVGIGDSFKVDNSISLLLTGFFLVCYIGCCLYIFAYAAQLCNWHGVQWQGNL